MMAETAFGVAYDGAALRGGQMPVRDLAPALLALGELFTEASALLHPEREPVALNIKATEEGSFLVHLILESKDGWDALTDVFGSDGVNALINLKDVVISGAGVIWLIKKLNGRHVAKQEETAIPGHIRLTLDDGTTLEIRSEVLMLHRNIRIRKQVREVVAPLKRNGIERVKFIEDTSEVVVERADLPAYELPEAPDEPLLDQEREMIVEIASVAFTDGNKWRFTDGQQTFYATVEDPAFLQRVDSGEAFRKGDMLRCRMRIVQTRRAGAGLQTDYTVVEVIEHIPRWTQLALGD